MDDSAPGCFPGLRPDAPRSDRSRGFFLYGLSDEGGFDDVEESLSSRQPLFAPGTARRRNRPAETARTLHRLIAELTALAVAATVTERVTIRQAPGGTTQTMPLFNDGGNDR